jgi:hypothetical protein
MSATIEARDKAIARNKGICHTTAAAITGTHKATSILDISLSDTQLFLSLFFWDTDPLYVHS